MTDMIVENKPTKPTKTFDYGFAKVRDFAVSSKEVNAGRNGKQKRHVVNTVTINDEVLKPSKRFWTSIQTRFGFTANFFRYFTHKEVFERIAERSSNDDVKYCIERDNKTGVNTLLAVTNPTSSTVRHDQLTELLTKYNAGSINYSNGVVRSTHVPKVGGTPFNINGDEFLNQFVIDTPIDGYGRPNVYLSLLRMICANGAVGYGKAFRSELSTGKTDEDVSFALIRAMDGFNNEEGFAAMRQRFESSQRSWASVNEIQRAYKTLLKLAHNKGLQSKGREAVQTTNGLEYVETASPIFHNFHKMSGDISRIYGLTNLDSLSVKRQKTLPAACKVYDLLNFVTETASHHSTAYGDRALQVFVGDIISNEYDLEGTVDHFSDWRDFFIGDEKAAETMEQINRQLAN